MRSAKLHFQGFLFVLFNKMHDVVDLQQKQACAACLLWK